MSTFFGRFEEDNNSSRLRFTSLLMHCWNWDFLSECQRRVLNIILLQKRVFLQFCVFRNACTIYSVMINQFVFNTSPRRHHNNPMPQYSRRHRTYLADALNTPNCIAIIMEFSLYISHYVYNKMHVGNSLKKFIRNKIIIYFLWPSE